MSDLGRTQARGRILCATAQVHTVTSWQHTRVTSARDRCPTTACSGPTASLRCGHRARSERFAPPAAEADRQMTGIMQCT